MYSVSQILTGITNPASVGQELSWIANRKLRGNDGIELMAQDWDNLVILDACRYDMFEEVSSLVGSLSRVVSKGSNTEEFLKRNFTSDSYPDTVYISANPQVQNHGIDEKFHDRVRLWVDHWDEELRTVLPSDVVTRSVAANEEFPNKRLIIHFIQPHYPFIGERGRKIEHGTLHGGGVIADERDADSVWKRLENGELSKETVLQAYYENLEITLPHVESLLMMLDGKSVVTSDHGNLLGETGRFGHPGRHFHPALVDVPWLEFPFDTRRSIQSDSIRHESGEFDEVEDRLNDLGYR
jgi:hypothetical protein